MLIFKEIFNLSKGLEQKKKVLKNSKINMASELKEVEERIQLYNLLKEYMLSLKWLSHAATKQKMQIYFSFQLDVRQACDYLKVDITEYMNTIYNASKKFKSLVGANIVDIIAKGSLIKAKMKIYTILDLPTYKDNIFLMNFKDIIKQQEEHTVSEERLNIKGVQDCLKEVVFLKNYSTALFTKELQQVDIQKLKYIIMLLDSKNNDLSELLNNFFQDAIPVDVFKQELNNFL